MPNDRYGVNIANIAYVWEQRKLGEVFSETISYVDPKLEDLELWSVTTENGLVPKESRYNRQFLVKKQINLKKFFQMKLYIIQ